MVRKRKKMALYEVISRTRSKSGYGKALEPLHPEDSAEEQSTAQVPGKQALWPTRPRLLQFNAGRIEISMSYELAVALLLGAILLVLVVFRLGQMTYLGGQKTADVAEGTVERTQEVVPQATAGAPQKPEPAEKILPNAEKITPPKPTGNNNIVIVQYALKADLEPVKAYFSAAGIETAIIREGEIYYLITNEQYENPGRAGTDGYHALNKIKEVGAKYKAPQGYETFGKKPFQDAYGKRFDD